MIIDCHCHAGKGDGFTGPWDTDASLHNYLPWATEAGITKTVLFAAFNSNYTKANAAVAKIVNSNPNKLWLCFCECCKRCRQYFQHGKNGCNAIWFLWY
jgi:uncharacterized protein